MGQVEDFQHLPINQVEDFQNLPVNQVEEFRFHQAVRVAIQTDLEEDLSLALLPRSTVLAITLPHSRREDIGRLERIGRDQDEFPSIFVH
jgi:hypothetical protein